MWVIGFRWNIVETPSLSQNLALFLSVAVKPVPEAVSSDARAAGSGDLAVRAWCQETWGDRSPAGDV